ncbi:MAG TPA: helix-turn-helix transcriptional regulator [Saprospiraceae bacterium]|nr:helix-turn-helix transcriptional regulator [Saprospiraceae bacterium]
MAFSKQSLYSRELQIISGFMKALSFPGRLEILLKLESEGPLTVNQLAKGHPICRETISQHLKILRKAHLVIADERYPYTLYRVHVANMRKARKALDWFFKHFSGGKKRS